MDKLNNPSSWPNRFPNPFSKRRKEMLDASTSFRSRLKGSKDAYSMKDSPLQSFSITPGIYFSESFKGLFPESRDDLKGYVQDILSSKKGEAVGVEFGGPGEKLFLGFDKDFFKKTLGVTLMDVKHKKQIPENSPISFLNNHIENSNHSMLEGDIFLKETYEKLSSWLAGQKVDLIIERMLKGLELVPEDPYVIGKTLEIWYELLSEEGVMFIQTPTVFNNLLEKWAEKVKKEFNNVIELEYKIGTIDNSAQSSAFRLRKLPGAPKKLPLLDTITTKEIPPVYLSDNL